MLKERTKEFLDKAKERFGDKYIYNINTYENARTNMEIICPKHGLFLQKPGQYIDTRHKVKISCRKCNHTWMAAPHMLTKYNPSGCPICGMRRASVSKRLSEEDFINRLHITNPNILYTKGQFKTVRSRLDLTCKACGHKWQTEAGSLIRTKDYRGCVKCNMRARPKRTKEQRQYAEFIFLAKLKKYHPNIKCAKGIYMGNTKNVHVSCSDCGHAWDIGAAYVASNKFKGCPKCIEVTKKEKLIDKYNHATKQFVKKLKEINPDIKYLGVGIKSSSSKISVSCKICGHTWRTQADSLIRSRPRGCAKCHYKRLTLTEDTVINRIKKTHPTLSYQPGAYIGKRERLPVTCTICNHKWLPLASSLLCNNPPSGCPKCSLPKYEKIANKLLDKLNILYEFQYIMPEDTTREGCYRFNYDLYIPELKLLIEIDEPHHYVHATSKENIDLQQRDMDKNKLAKLHNYRLVRIPVAKGAHPDVVKDPLIHAIVQYGGKFIHKGKLYKTALELHKATKLHKDIKEYNKYKLKNVFKIY